MANGYYAMKTVLPIYILSVISYERRTFRIKRLSAMGSAEPEKPGALNLLHHSFPQPLPPVSLLP